MDAQTQPGSAAQLDQVEQIEMIEMVNQARYVMEFTRLLEAAMMASKEYEAAWATYRKDLEDSWMYDTLTPKCDPIANLQVTLWKARIAFSKFVEEHAPEPPDRLAAPVEVPPTL